MYTDVDTVNNNMIGRNAYARIHSGGRLVENTERAGHLPTKQQLSRISDHLGKLKGTVDVILVDFKGSLFKNQIAFLNKYF